MEIKLTNKESEDIFYNSLCNGLNQMVYYELRLTYNGTDYEQARSKFSEQPCYEDVLMQILRDGNSLTMVDIEGEESYSINLQDVHERVQQAPFSVLLEVIDERDDADTADAILQQVFFGEVMFG